jgi:uncharacterized SAM-binding protein YcdF (DUF218 family)
MGRIGTIACITAGLVIIVFMVINCFAGELSPFGCGVLFIGFGLLFLPLVAYIFKVSAFKYYGVLAHAALFILVACVAVMIALSAVMIGAARDNPKNIPKNAAVVVPGCLLHGDKPGEMLQSRLDTALGYLKAHPQAVCVVCGGYIGRYTQGAVMQKYLVQKGVAPSRILVDDKSDTTYENLKNAKTLLPGKKEIAIATDVYHQYRSKLYAKKLGFVPYALPSVTPLRHYFDSWPREYLAIIKAWITGK